MNILRLIFRLLNKFFMIPVFKLGLGPFMGNPISGYIMVLKTIGHKSGLTRYAPVNYAILDGNIYCLSGFGKLAHWYKNLAANPNIEMILPSATLLGKAATVMDADEWLRATRQILKNGGFAGFLAGYNAWTITDEELREKGKDMVVIRISPEGIYGGAADPGGKLWLWLTIAVIALIIILLSI
ncbi:MAG: nitroreductase family deazaflavin-dependent oxidoreductase [Anaerolineae bacterium]|jgi:deazaflavin-dependent oxidoreductase (nitroreductase family)|nr:nitroreductase family deazaflavin-dependent oxidoreductase [Anaerolineae bacterium]MBT7991263.1 nitroreductase family deazaflavin-dependent oxidoreductase [Anaerolineae bacterium]